MAADTKLDRNKKYDRQLRLWGDHGQDKLQRAKVCLINATATGTEILKNLILPGIGSFTVIDGHQVTSEDVGNNFFLDKNSIGKSRAKYVTQLLQDLNSDVRGDAIEEHVENLLQNDSEFFMTFSIVIATSLPERVLLKLGETLWKQDIPFIICRSYGMVGYIRLVVNEHAAIETHPDNSHHDLRLDNPFPELRAYIDPINLSAMDKKEHSQTPFIVILLKYMDQWRNLHDGALPKTYKEKDQFKQMIANGIMQDSEGRPEEEDNFQEAIKNALITLVPTKIPSSVEALLKDEKCLNMSPDSSNFWILVRALKEFVDKTGTLPVRGSIPDMTADSTRYINLQRIYQAKANEDASKMTEYVKNILESLGKGVNSISVQEISNFCKNAFFLKVIRTHSLADEYNPSTIDVSEIRGYLESGSHEANFYVLLRAVDKFFEQYNRYPGMFDDQVETDIWSLRNCVNGLLHDWSLPNTISDDYIHEMCRYGASELHTMAAFLGGAAAQEAVKIITHQFVPFNNTFIFNGISASSVTFNL
ncbi:NEDD8-activating enzyme E1 regulatory subunit [Trichoplax sp. H2]|nr:NEDD8-activating enzyme E1 regulatory subunit [Trichoplax sp. H2]|eukprot:RDD43316.1 NEDD8-activating enzyme E1 regulatory subunit [Trichoplax sp. H2]